MSEGAPAAAAERRFKSMEALVPALAREIAGRLGEAVRARGVASFVATGGTTPGPLYDALSQVDLPWERVFVTLSDERWVDPSDEASNAHLLRARLLQNRAAIARFKSLKTADATPAAAETAVNAVINRLPRPFDVVLLGMGADGHVASLFPNDPATIRATDLAAPDQVCAVKREGAAGSDARLSLTFRALRDARWTALLIKGEDKLGVAQRAQAGDDIAELPVRGVLNDAAAPVEFWWTA
jgi:6-phosphogluconolactonase